MIISLIQADIVWENTHANLRYYAGEFKKLAGKTDLAILPEMCLSGFGSSVPKVSEENNGSSISFLQECAKEYNMAICGSFAAREGNPPRYFNRAFFLYPDGKAVFYDKRHLFRMGDEARYLEAGEKPCLLNYKGWNIFLTICYDLRFPVWCRNKNNQYDLLICSANWPDARIRSWNNLLEARATENQAYVCGVNRVGRDGLGIPYSGHSAVYDSIGRRLNDFLPEEACTCKVEINYERLLHHREKFPAWKDADHFSIDPLNSSK